MTGQSQDLNQVLEGLQRAEFDRCLSLQNTMRIVQIAIAILGAGSAFLNAPIYNMILAAVALILAVAYAWLGNSYKSCRSHAERVRRTTLLSKGLGINISPIERTEMLTLFSSSLEAGRKAQDDNYYASKEQVGKRRLIEMLEESAFWSADLYRHAETRAWIRAGVFLVITVLALIFLPIFTGLGLQAINASQGMCAILVLFVSGEVIGAALAYREAADAAKSVVQRLQRLKEKSDENLSDDILMILGDYNSAVEGAPMVPAKIYLRRKDKINAHWSDQKQF
jgi:hypothetical protein